MLDNAAGGRGLMLTTMTARQTTHTHTKKYTEMRSAGSALLQRVIKAGSCPTGLQVLGLVGFSGTRGPALLNKVGIWCWCPTQASLSLGFVPLSYLSPRGTKDR